MSLVRSYEHARTSTQALAVLAACVPGASVGLAAVEAAWPWTMRWPSVRLADRRVELSYLLSFLVLCLIPIGGSVGGLLWRRLSLLARLGVGLGAWAATVALYRVFDGVLNGGFLSPC